MELHTSHPVHVAGLCNTFVSSRSDIVSFTTYAKIPWLVTTSSSELSVSSNVCLATFSFAAFLMATIVSTRRSSLCSHDILFGSCWLTPLCPFGVSRGPGSIFGILVIGGSSRVSSGIGRTLGSTSRISDLGQRLGKFNMFMFGTFPITDCALSSVRTSSSVILEPCPSQLPLHHISSAYPARKLAGCAFAINALGGSEARTAASPSVGASSKSVTVLDLDDFRPAHRPQSNDSDPESLPLSPVRRLRRE